MTPWTVAPKPPEKPWKRTHEGFTGLTTESLEAYRTAWRAYEQAMRDWHTTLTTRAREAASTLVALGFPDTFAVRVQSRGRWKVRTTALVDHLRAFLPSASPLSLWLTEEESWLRQAAERERRRQAEAATAALRDRAVAWLLGRGKVYGEDFTADTAAHVALQIAGAEEIKKRKGQWNSFHGQNCDEVLDDERTCRGWDGESHRCDCGNRRVSWEIEGTFEEPYAYGEAY